jgi:hypothetical protein
MKKIALLAIVFFGIVSGEEECKKDEPIPYFQKDQNSQLKQTQNEKADTYIAAIWMQ